MEAGKHLEEKNLNCELIRQIRKLEPTDHVALISSCREDELLALISFIELGLARGELCCVFAKRDLCLTIQAGLAGARGLHPGVPGAPDAEAFACTAGDDCGGGRVGGSGKGIGQR